MSSQSEVIETPLVTSLPSWCAGALTRVITSRSRSSSTKRSRAGREARARVTVTGLTDEDIDRLIEEARKEAQPPLG
jgi:hypothetical protein